VLPYLEQQELFGQFHLDEPWDSPHNLPLVEQMPYVYRAPGRKARLLPPGHTVCHVFVGPGTAFEDPRGTLLSDFPDNTVYTLLIIEAGPPVPWTKPEEIPYRSDQDLPEIKRIFKNGFRFATAAGSVHLFPNEKSEADLRALITRNGGEEFEHGWDFDQ